MIKTGEFQMSGDGLSTTNPESSIVMHASQLVLNDTSSSPNGATLSVSTAVHLATGQPFVITGQSAILTGGETVIDGGHGSSRGGDTVINGGKAESRHGDVIIGDKSYRCRAARSERCEERSDEAPSWLIANTILTSKTPSIYHILLCDSLCLSQDYAGLEPHRDKGNEPPPDIQRDGGRSGPYCLQQRLDRLQQQRFQGWG